MGTVIVVLIVLSWIWCIWEAMNSPIYPDDWTPNDYYNEEGVTKDWNEIEKKEYDDEIK